jgi:hypothetical protein
MAVPYQAIIAAPMALVMWSQLDFNWGKTLQIQLARNSLCELGEGLSPRSATAQSKVSFRSIPFPSFPPHSLTWIKSRTPNPVQIVNMYSQYVTE